VALVGCAHAAVAGVLASAETGRPGSPVVAAGLGATAAAFVAGVGLASHRVFLAPPAAVGLVVVMSGLVRHWTGIDPAVTLTVAMVVAVIGGIVAPTLAVAVTRIGAGPCDSGDRPVDLSAIAGAVGVAHEISVAATASAGLLLVVVAPFAVSLGAAGTAASVLASLVVLLRAGRVRSRADVAIGLLSGAAGLIVTGLAVAWLHPAGGLAAAFVLQAGGVALLARLAAVRAGSPRTSTLAETVEGAMLVALVPTAVAATGILGVIRR
jgi:hypothetical protein